MTTLEIIEHYLNEHNIDTKLLSGARILEIHNLDILFTYVGSLIQINNTIELHTRTRPPHEPHTYDLANPNSLDQILQNIQQLNNP